MLCVLSSPPPAISCGPLTVSSIPVTHGVVAGLVAVVVSDPVRGAALGTVGHWPGEVHLHKKTHSNIVNYEGKFLQLLGGEDTIESMSASRKQMTDLLTSLWCVEVLWPYWGSKHDIIIEIDEPAGDKLTHSYPV